MTLATQKDFSRCVIPKHNSTARSIGFNNIVNNMAVNVLTVIHLAEGTLQLTSLSMLKPAVGSACMGWLDINTSTKHNNASSNR